MNRYGPGLVIYWFGFQQSIVPLTQKACMIMDHFPLNIDYMSIDERIL